MKASSYYSPKLIKIEEKPVPEIGPKDLLLEVKATGICGTDLHIYKGEFPVAKTPITLGHESAGRVVQVGKDVNNLKLGDDIALDSNISCGECDFCRAGKRNLCNSLQIMGVTIDGTFAQFAKVPASIAYKMPVALPYEEAAMAEPLACCLHGMDVARIRIGDSVAVFGAGPIGLLLAQLASLAGAVKVFITDVSAERLKIAEKLGATAFEAKDFMKKVRETTGSYGVDVSIEAAGNPVTAVQALQVIKKGGRAVIFGASPETAEIKIRPYDVYNREISVEGSFIDPNTFDRAIELIESGKIEVKSLITHIFPLENLVHGLELLDRKAAVKVVIKP